MYFGFSAGWAVPIVEASVEHEETGGTVRAGLHGQLTSAGYRLFE